MRHDVVAHAQEPRGAERCRPQPVGLLGERAPRGRRPGCVRPPRRRSGCRPGRRSRSVRRPPASSTTWLLVITWPCRSSTNPEPVAPPASPSNSAEIWTVLGSSCSATAVTEPLSSGSGGAEIGVDARRARPRPPRARRPRAPGPAMSPPLHRTGPAPARARPRRPTSTTAPGRPGSREAWSGSGRVAPYPSTGRPGSGGSHDRPAGSAAAASCDSGCVGSVSRGSASPGSRPSS